MRSSRPLRVSREWSMIQAPRPASWQGRAGTCHTHRAFTARITVTIPIRKFDGLPSDLVRPHPVSRGDILDIFDCGVLKMPRGRLAFKQGDVTRALRAVSAAGQPVQRIEINREGKIVVFVGKTEQQEGLGDNEWDKI